MDLSKDPVELRRALDDRVQARERLAREIAAIKVLLGASVAPEEDRPSTYSDRILVALQHGGVMTRAEILAAVNVEEPSLDEASLGGLLSKLRKDGRVANPKRGSWCAV